MYNVWHPLGSVEWLNHLKVQDWHVLRLHISCTMFALIMMFRIKRQVFLCGFIIKDLALETPTILSKQRWTDLQPQEQNCLKSTRCWTWVSHCMWNTSSFQDKPFLGRQSDCTHWMKECFVHHHQYHLSGTESEKLFKIMLLCYYTLVQYNSTSTMSYLSHTSICWHAP